MSKHKIYKSEQGRQQILDDYECYLNLFDVSFEREYVITRFGETHVLITGPEEGQPLFILQGGNCINPITLSWFSSLFGEYRVYAPDTIGHPGYSAQTRISAKDESFALWLADLMDAFNIQTSAFVAPSYGAGIILRLATFMPERITCAVLVSPAGLALGSKLTMVRKILFPLLAYKMNSSAKPLQKIADIMSQSSMKEMDKRIIGNIFSHTKLEQDMPKLTERQELRRYSSPTMIIAGKGDVFFPAGEVVKAASEVFKSVTIKSYDMGHFPAPSILGTLNEEIKQFLRVNYVQ